MTHEEFVGAYREGRIQVQVNRSAAARLVSARMLLPFILLPLLGVAVALALTGYLIVGVGLFLAALALRFLVRASSQGYVLSRALQDAAFYAEMVGNRVLLIQSRDSS
jgi:hypothetical protein